MKAAEGATEFSNRGLKAYWIKSNLKSLDGLPGLRHAHMSQDVPQYVPGAGREGTNLGGGEEEDCGCAWRKKIIGNMSNG